MSLNRQKLSNFILFIGGLTLMSLYFSTNKVSSINELRKLKVTFVSSSFKKYYSVKTGNSFSYKIRLGLPLGREQDFDISSDFAKGFKRGFFEKNVKAGDSLEVFFYNEVSERKFDNNKSEIFGVYLKDVAILDKEYSLEKNASRRKILIGFGLFLLMGSVVIFFFSKSGKKLLRFRG